MQKPGWYTSPDGTDSLRWWDGTKWTDHVAVREVVQPTASTTGGAASIPARARISNRNMLLLIGGAALALILGINGIAAAVSSGGSSAPAALASATPSATPKPTPTGPKVTYQTVLEDEVIPFNRVTQDDPNTAAGTSFVSTPGVDGKHTRTYRVTFHDGVEVSRSLTSEGVSLAPVDEVTVNGTYVAPAPAPVAEAPSGGCDPNYADGCVPIASDVDCAGGSGNGPAYFSGTARVVGSDIYDLDRDGNGIACQS